MANIYQAGGKAVGKLLGKGAPSKVYSTGAKKESAIAEKLGAAFSEKAAGEVTPEIQTKLGAMEAMKLLQEEGTPTFKTTQADLQSLAKDNPNASPEELAAMYRGPEPAKPTPYRMKEKVEPVSAPREIEEPSSQERVYEAYGKAADGETSFAGEDGPGLEGLVSRPQDEIVGAGMGGLPADATLADRISNKKKLTTAQKAGIGLAAAGGAGMVKGALTPEAPRKAAGKPAVEEKVSAEAEEMTKEKQGELAPPSGGDVSKPSQTLKKPTAAGPQSQRQIALSTQVDVNTFQNKLASGQPITRADLLAITSKMEELKPNEVTTDQSLIQKIEAAKDEARRAYQEEANRNQWAEVAQTLGNAVATFIAARQGVADRPLTLPQIDYGARTGQALRAYQTELASAGEQARTLERETERKQSAEDRKVALQQRQYERLLALGENAIAAQERKAERNQDLATRLEIAQLRNEKDRQVQEAKNQKAAIQAKQQGEDKLSKFLASDIKRTNQEILRLNKQLESANVVAAAKDTKDFEKALPDYMTTSGIDINTPEFQKKGWFGGVSPDQDKIKASAKAAAARILQQVKELQAKKASSEQELQGLKPGAGAAAAPTRQEPVSGGTVTLRDPKSGRTKQVVWDKAAQAIVQSGQLELVK